MERDLVLNPLITMDIFILMQIYTDKNKITPFGLPIGLSFKDEELTVKKALAKKKKIILLSHVPPNLPLLPNKKKKGQPSDDYEAISPKDEDILIEEVYSTLSMSSSAPSTLATTAIAAATVIVSLSTPVLLQSMLQGPLLMLPKFQVAASSLLCVPITSTPETIIVSSATGLPPTVAQFIPPAVTSMPPIEPQPIISQALLIILFQDVPIPAHMMDIYTSYIPSPLPVASLLREFTALTSNIVYSIASSAAETSRMLNVDANLDALRIPHITPSLSNKPQSVAAVVM